MTSPTFSTARRTVLASGRLAALLLVTGLAACGGSDDNANDNAGPPVASNTPPASASTDAAGFIAYLKVLVPTRPETTEPLDVAAFVAPVDDTAEPDSTI